MKREDAIQILKDTYAHWIRLKDEDILPCSECEEVTEAIDTAISALSVIDQTKWERDTALATLEEHGIGLGEKAKPIERISDNTIVVKYADYEDIGRIILTDGDIFCKMFYEDNTEDTDDDYINDIPSEYLTEPSATNHENEQNCGDLISRADAIKTVISWLPKEHHLMLKGTLALEDIVNALDSVPSVSAERVGVWNLVDGYRCSICGYKLMQTGIPTYCPNCGAKMKGGTE